MEKVLEERNIQILKELPDFIDYVLRKECSEEFFEMCQSLKNTINLLLENNIVPTIAAIQRLYDLV